MKPLIGDPVPKWAYSGGWKSYRSSPIGGRKYRGLYCAVKGYRRRKRVARLGNDYHDHGDAPIRLSESEAGWRPAIGWYPGPLGASFPRFGWQPPRKKRARKRRKRAR